MGKRRLQITLFFTLWEGSFLQKARFLLEVVAVGEHVFAVIWLKYKFNI
jgi:hypothetical protein